MKSAKTILTMIPSFYRRIRSVVETTQAYYSDCYGIELHGYEQPIQSESKPDEVIINKLLQFEKRLSKAESEIKHYNSIITCVESACILNLTNDELDVVRRKYFGMKEVTRVDIADELHYSEEWVAKRLVSAYQKLDQVFATMESLPVELT